MRWRSAGGPARTRGKLSHVPRTSLPAIWFEKTSCGRSERAGNAGMRDEMASVEAAPPPLTSEERLRRLQELIAVVEGKRVAAGGVA